MSDGLSFLEALGLDECISEDSARCLYTGIMTDTGGFRFRSTSATTHRIVANLIEKGADPAQITSDTWDTNTVSRLAFALFSFKQNRGSKRRKSLPFFG